MFPIRPPDYVGIPANSSCMKSSSSSGRRRDGTTTITSTDGSRTSATTRSKNHHHDRNLGVEVLMGQAYHNDIQHNDRGGENETEAGIEVQKCEKILDDIESCSSKVLKNEKKKATNNNSGNTTNRCSIYRRNSKNLSYRHDSTKSCSSSSSSFADASRADSFVEYRSKGVNVNNHQQHGVDPSVVLSLERTLFAALNNAWLLAIGGIGLMSVGHGDQRARNGGIAILVGGIASALLAYGMHLVRVVQLRKNIRFCYSQSVFWASVISLMTVVCCDFTA